MTDATATNDDRNEVTTDLGRIAIAHLGLGLVLVSVFTWIEPLEQPRNSGLAGFAMLIASLVVGIAGLAISGSQRTVRRSLYGAFAFGSAAYLAGAVGIWANDGGVDIQLTVALAGAVGGFAAFVLHARRAAVGTVLALGLSAVAVALGLVTEHSTSDRSAAAAALFAVAVLFALGGLLGALKPAVTAGFVTVVTGLAAAAIIVSHDVDAGPALLALAMMLAVNFAILPMRLPSVVVALAIGDALVIALVAREWGAPNWYTVGPAAGGFIAFALAAHAERTAAAGTKLRLGGAYTLCALLVLLGAGNLGVTQPVLQDLLAVAVLLGLAVAAASVGRLLVTALAVVDLVGLAPGRFAASSASDRHTEEVLLIIAGLLILAIAASGGSRTTTDAAREG